MKTVTVDLTCSNTVACPHCSEEYTLFIDERHAPKPGETQTHICDGEGGCGRTFLVKFTRSS